MLVVLADWLLTTKASSPVFQSARGPIGRSSPQLRAVPVEETLPPSSRLRLRVRGAVDTRLMLSHSTSQPLILAVDGQPCEVFEPVRQRIPLGPGARFDVMLDLPGDAGVDANVTWLETRPDRVLLAKTEGKAYSLPPSPLAQNPLLPRSSAGVT
jgi:FtsP/CotA-like multicopper oxidase with cupredoxin domain